MRLAQLPTVEAHRHGAGGLQLDMDMKAAKYGHGNFTG